MKIKTADLIGPALDWAVAECLGATRIQLYQYNGRKMIRVSLPEGIHAPWEPSRYWGQGGPIIEREEIRWNKQGERYYAWIGGTHHDPLHTPLLAEDPIPYPTAFEYGAAILIAAMRCFVASRLGDEVEVPDALVQ